MFVNFKIKNEWRDEFIAKKKQKTNKITIVIIKLKFSSYGFNLSKKNKIIGIGNKYKLKFLATCTEEFFEIWFLINFGVRVWIIP